MTARDPELQHAVDRAAGELARRIRANPAPADPDAMAREFVEWQYTGPDHWRPWPRTPGIPPPAAGDPAAAHRGATYARDLLKRTTEGDRDAPQ